MEAIDCYFGDTPNVDYCGWRWLLMDTIDQMMWVPMAVDGHKPSSTVGGDGYIWRKYWVYTRVHEL